MSHVRVSFAASTSIKYSLHEYCTVSPAAKNMGSAVLPVDNTDVSDLPVTVSMLVTGSELVSRAEVSGCSCVVLLSAFDSVAACVVGVVATNDHTALSKDGGSWQTEKKPSSHQLPAQNSAA